MSEIQNHIGKIDAEWVDPKVELPPDRWEGPVNYDEHAMRREGRWLFFTRSGALVSFGSPWRWLRIGGPSTAIPREQVQAAANEIHEKAHYWMGECQHEAPYHEVGDMYGGIAKGLKTAMDIIRRQTGIEPKKEQS